MAPSDATGMVGGILVDRYELTAHLRPGRFGDFWRGKRLADGAPVAIKLLKPELFSDENAVRRFDREARVLASFEHPNLLRVIEHGRTPTGVAFVVTEPHDGRILSDAVAELSLTIDAVRHIGAQVALVLATAHERGVVHRGLDPEAILLVREGADPDRVKVQDFGLAHLAMSADLAGEGEQLTQVGERLGRVEYMAPEYIEEQVLDARTDLYVLGVMLFEMVTGQPPFVGRSIQVMNKHVEEEPYAPSELSEHDVPPWLDGLVLALLAKDPDARPQSATMVARALVEGRWP